MCGKLESGTSIMEGFFLALKITSRNNSFPGIDGVNSSGIVQGYQRQNVCSPDPCVNGACKDLWTSYFCECNRHWTGINCTECKLVITLSLVTSDISISKITKDNSEFYEDKAERIFF